MVHPQAKLVYDIILSKVQERFEDTKGRTIDNIKPKLILKTNSGLQDTKQKLQMEQHEPHKQNTG